MNGWEETVIGTVLSDPATFVEADVLRPSDFTGVRQIV